MYEMDEDDREIKASISADNFKGKLVPLPRF